MTRVVFDYESGVEPHHPNIQLAAIAVDSQWNELAKFQHLIKFNEAEADPKALEINHYERERWSADAKTETYVTMAFADFCKRHAEIELISKRTQNPYKVAQLVGHNASKFDGPRLFTFAKQEGIFMPAAVQVMDTLQLAMWNKRTFENLRLTTIAAALGMDVGGAHDALADVRLCAGIAKRLTEER